jgi:hypothetical protein
MANVTTEMGVYDDMDTPQELHCRAIVLYDNVTGVVQRIESWENTYPFAWTLIPKPGEPPVTLAANSGGNRRNLQGTYLITDNWLLTRAP